MLPLFGGGDAPEARQAPPAAPGRAKRRTLAQSPHLPAAERLWALQERLRRELNPRTRALEASGPRGAMRLGRVIALLAAGWTEPELEQVVEAYAANARRDPAALRYLDGTSNWRPDNVDTTWGKLGTPRAPPRANGPAVAAVVHGAAYERMRPPPPLIDPATPEQLAAAKRALGIGAPS